MLEITSKENTRTIIDSSVQPTKKTELYYLVFVHYDDDCNIGKIEMLDYDTSKDHGLSAETLDEAIALLASTKQVVLNHMS